MSFEWYSPRAKLTEEVKISGTTVTITEAGLNKLREINPAFEKASYVALGWDSHRGLLGIAPLESNHIGAFKFGLRGRSQSTRTISAARFFDSYSIEALPSKTTASITTVDGVAAVPIPSRKAAGSMSVGDLPKRRGRKPKYQLIPS